MGTADAIDLEATAAASGVLTFGLVWIWLGLSASLSGRARRSKRVGNAVCSAKGDRRVALVLSLLVIVAILLAAISPLGPRLSLFSLTSVLALALIHSMPCPGAGCAGEDGISIGWESWTWQDVDHWRLVGEHLRIEVQGRWLALPVDAKHMGPLKEVLQGCIPERRSSFE